MFDARYFDALDLGGVFAKVMAGERLDLEDGQRLFACPDIHALGALAHHVRTRLHGDAAFYVLNRHVNYTNVCVNGCTFCAFSRKRDDQDGAFRLGLADIEARLEQAGDCAEVHIVGGCHPGLRLDFFETVLRRVKELLPGVALKAFTAVEIAHFAALEGMTTREVLAVLQRAGLDMLPGGGAEIFDPGVRTRICPEKADAATWLRVHGEAHGLGMRTNATMLYGHVETTDHRLAHLDALRRQQDATGGFVCFIPLPFLVQNNALGLEGTRGAHSGLDDLRTMAVSRLMLDNIPHLKAYWVMHSVKLAQAMLHYGADDLDGTVVEEKIGHMAGAESDQALTRAELTAMIRAAGFAPVQRDAFFNPVSAPDQQAGR
ncbi:MAG: aminofutalosine synthase MqnE [Desulfovibrionaceae bacterium]